MAHTRRTQADAETLRKRNIDLTGEVQKIFAHSTMNSARLKVVTEVLVCVKPKLTAGLMESAISRQSAYSVANDSSKVEEDVHNALMAVSGCATGETKRKVSFNGLELKDALKQVPAQILFKPQAAISQIRPELERDNGMALENSATS